MKKNTTQKSTQLKVSTQLRAGISLKRLNDRRVTISNGNTLSSDPAETAEMQPVDGYAI